VGADPEEEDVEEEEERKPIPKLKSGLSLKNIFSFRKDIIVREDGDEIPVWRSLLHHACWVAGVSLDVVLWWCSCGFVGLQLCPCASA
jgi:spore maturation protein CgeB